MKTIFYIDGFNLFNGRLSKTPYKWLDLCRFANSMCKVLGEPYSRFGDPMVRYYTSPIRRAFSTHPDSAPKNQNDYWIALQHVCGPNLVLYQGTFTDSRFFAYSAEEDSPPPGQQVGPSVRVWKLEEKRVDVAIASDLISDAVQHTAAAQVLVSNDEDLEPAINAVLTLAPDQRVALVVPSQKTDHGRLTRRPNTRLVAATKRNDVVAYIADSILSECLLPNPVRTPKRWIHCPREWQRDAGPASKTD